MLAGIDAAAGFPPGKPTIRPTHRRFDNRGGIACVPAAGGGGRFERATTKGGTCRGADLQAPVTSHRRLSLYSYCVAVSTHFCVATAKGSEFAAASQVAAAHRDRARLAIRLPTGAASLRRPWIHSTAPKARPRRASLPAATACRTHVAAFNARWKTIRRVDSRNAKSVATTYGSLRADRSSCVMSYCETCFNRGRQSTRGAFPAQLRPPEPRAIHRLRSLRPPRNRWSSCALPETSRHSRCARKSLCDNRPRTLRTQQTGGRRNIRGTRRRHSSGRSNCCTRRSIPSRMPAMVATDRRRDRGSV